jgi:hypothetical protein
MSEAGPYPTKETYDHVSSSGVVGVDTHADWRSPGGWDFFTGAVLDYGVVRDTSGAVLSGVTWKPRGPS